VHAGVRIIAATNARLDQLVEEGRFRGHLECHLHVGRLHVPPLRERREEIPLLINYDLELAALVPASPLFPFDSPRLRLRTTNGGVLVSARDAGA
jgi:DNA-binding NtrC family response regulator